MGRNVGDIWAADIAKATDKTVVMIGRQLVMGKYFWTKFAEVAQDGWVVIPAPKETFWQWLLRKVGL